MYCNPDIVSNICELNKAIDAGENLCVNKISFEVVPNKRNICRLDIATRNRGTGGIVRLNITDSYGSELRSIHTQHVAHNGYTALIFEPLNDIHIKDNKRPLIFNIDAVGEAYIVINPAACCDGGVSLNTSGRLGIRLYVKYTDYCRWISKNLPSEEVLQVQKNKKFAFSPLISIITTVGQSSDFLPRALLSSVLSQTYPNWELCIVDQGFSPDSQEIINNLADSRIHYKKFSKDSGLAGALNGAIEMSSGEYICFLSAGDTLAPHALYSNVELINTDNEFDLLYSDEDVISADGQTRFQPRFKPDFSPDLLLANNYIGNLLVLRRSLLNSTGLLDPDYGEALYYDLVLRAVEKAKKIGHISDVLYHVSEGNNKTDYSEDFRNAVNSALKRRNVDGNAISDGALYHKINYILPKNKPKISVIIPNHNEQATLKRCVDSIIKASTYENYEILIIENNSTQKSLFDYYDKISKNQQIRILELNKPFNYSELNNFGASNATGEMLLFLNNDTRVITRDWLEQMSMHALQKHVGAVGAKMLYPDGAYQHVGVVLGLGGVAGHPFCFEDSRVPSAYNRAGVVSDVSAVTGACMMVEKRKFNDAGGFWEDLAVAFNDVDFCLSLLEKGYYNIYTPYAELYHYESKTRGYEDTPEKIKRFARESELFIKKWGKKYPYDPFYNRNLSVKCGDYSVNTGIVLPMKIF